MFEVFLSGRADNVLGLQDMPGGKSDQRKGRQEVLLCPFYPIVSLVGLVEKGWEDLTEELRGSHEQPGSW